MTLVDANGHGLEGPDSEELPKMGAESKEESNRKTTGMMDPRLLRSGELMDGFCTVMTNIFFLSMELNRLMMMHDMEKRLVESKELLDVKDQMGKLQHARAAMASIIDDRFAGSDAAWWAKYNIEPPVE